jgi:hypothetical protein
MSTPAKNGRFLIENQTHYNTADIVALLDFFIDKETPQEEHHWRRRAPHGAVIQIQEFNGDARYNRTTEYSKKTNEWEFAKKRVYVLPEDTKMWHVIKIVPPSRIFENELEALSADMTKMPEDMYHQLFLRLSGMVNASFTWSQQENIYPDGFTPGSIRIETERQGKRKAATRRPAELFELREKEQTIRSDLMGIASRSNWAAARMNSIESARTRLGLSSLTPYAERLAHLHLQLKALSDEFDAIAEATPTA